MKYKQTNIFSVLCTYNYMGTPAAYGEYGEKGKIISSVW